MRALIALVRREYLEHRIAFVYVPLALLVIVSAAFVYFLLAGEGTIVPPSGTNPAGNGLYRVAAGGAFFLWSAYLIVALFFYYADSFSADRRNNALLFWKSMPQSDLKVLASKALSGITVFLFLILGFALVTSALAYVFVLAVSAQYAVVAAPGLSAAGLTLIQMLIVGFVYYVLNVLWYAPFLAWVAGLSTLFQRWSIPLAVLVPGIVMLIEFLNTVRNPLAGTPVADFLIWRSNGFVDEDIMAATLFSPGGTPFELIPMMLSDIDRLHLFVGFVFTVAIVWLASEYRRRRIQA